MRKEAQVWGDCMHNRPQKESTRHRGCPTPSDYSAVLDRNNLHGESFVTGDHSFGTRSPALLEKGLLDGTTNWGEGGGSLHLFTSGLFVPQRQILRVHVSTAISGLKMVRLVGCRIMQYHSPWARVWNILSRQKQNTGGVLIGKTTP